MNLSARAPRLSSVTLAVAAALGYPVLAQAVDEPAAASRELATEIYAINFESTTLPIKPADRPALAELKNRTLYVIPVDIRGVTWYRLRAGFFNSKQEAEAVLARYEAQFPDGWVARIDQEEARQAISGKPIAAPTLPPAPAAQPGGDPNTEMMRQARDAMLIGDYQRAIRLYSQVTKSPSGPYAQEAQELLGLARERAGQAAQARTEYETYLKNYPQGEGAERVRQRLLGLVTAREANPSALRAARADKGDKSWRGFGSVAQYVRWDQYTYADMTSSETLYITDLDYTVRRRGLDYDLRGRVSGQYYPASTTSRGHDGRVSTLYAEALSTGDAISGSVGRQSRSDSGILGRFDGAIVTEPFGSRYRVNFAGGAPVEYGYEDRINSHKHFFGMSFDALQLGGAVDTNTWFIQQQVDGILDRQAVGAEVRYLKEGRSLFALVDYDTSYATVNSAMALAGLSRPDGASLNLILDYRMTPVLTTSNALISQTATTISELLDTMTETRVRQLARDRTALSRSATVSASLPLDRRYQVMGDVTVSSLTGTPPSGNTAIDPLTGLPTPGSVPATPPTGTQYYYSLQLVGNDLLKQGDSTIVGTRYSVEKDADTVSLSLNHRRPVTETFYLNPRLRLDSRKDSVNGDQSAVALALRATSQYTKELWLEAEAGGEWRDQKVSSGSGNMELYYVYAGIRKDF